MAYDHSWETSAPGGAIAVLIVSLAARSSLRVGAVAGLGAATADLC